MKVRVGLDRELVAKIDELVGKRERQAFIEEAIGVRLQREVLRRAMANAKGSLEAKDYPHWATPALVTQWVHDMRMADQDLMNARAAERQRERERQLDNTRDWA